jgi:hypothetical protein
MFGKATHKRHTPSGPRAGPHQPPGGGTRGQSSGARSISPHSPDGTAFCGENPLAVVSAHPRALKKSGATGEVFWDTELHRLTGTVRLAENQFDDGQISLQQAIYIARGRASEIAGVRTARDLGLSGASSAAAPRPAICGTGLRLVHRARWRGLAHRGRRVEAHVGGASLDPSRPNHNLLAVPEAPPAARSSDAFSRFSSIFKPLRAASDRPFPDDDDSGDRRKGPDRRGLATNRRNRMTKIITCSERAAPILPEGKQPNARRMGNRNQEAPLPPSGQ